MLRSPHARATFKINDLDAFLADNTDIETILTAADVPGENSFGIYPDLKDQPVFADGLVRYRGEAVLAVVGTKEAVDSLDFATLPIDWTPEAPISGVSAALHEGAASVHANTPDNVLTRGRLRKGTTDGAFDNGAVATGDLQTAFVEHAYIEPEAGFAERVGNRIEITACTQAPYMDLDECARVLGVEKDAVRIIPSACGGGFGGKLDASIQLPLAVAAWKLKRPVRAIYTRIESMASSTKRHPATITARAAADPDGLLSAFEMQADFDTGAYASWGPTVADRVPVHATGPYLVPNVSVDSRSIYTNAPPSGAFRGFGVPQAAILQERLYDDLAEQLGLDPFEFRHRNAIRTGVPTATGQVLTHSVGLVECLDALRPHWDTLRTEADRQNASNGTTRRRGVGVGCMWYGCGNTSMSNPSTMHVTLERDGKLTLFSGAVDIGQGSNTVMLQICADALGLPPADFSLVLGDTDLTADAGKTSASRQTFVSGKAAYNAGRAMRAEILRLANAGDGATLRLEGATVIVEEDGRTGTLDLTSLPTEGNGDIVLKSEGTFDPPTTPLDADGQGDPYATFGFAAQIADLEVDLELGTVHLRKIVAAHDLGRAINPTLVEGQIHGGIAQGIGLALMEEYIPGRTENLHDYLIPTFGDVPDIDVIVVEDPEPHGPYGAKGIGEPALVPTAPAIFGAIRHATGVRVSQVPLLPHRLKTELDALKGQIMSGSNTTTPKGIDRTEMFGAREGNGGIIRCDACPVLCRIRPGRTGACDRYANEDGRLIRTDALVLAARHATEGGEMVPFLANEPDWDGNPVTGKDVFITGIGSGTTYPDYKPAPFIVSSDYDGVDTVTVVTEGIFSYCGVKVKIDTDRHIGPETAAVRVDGEHVGHVTTAEYGSQMLSLGGVNHLTGGTKKAM